MFLCPSSFMTCRISLVFAYSMVAFQCLKVWKWILRIRSFLSLFATLALWLRKYLLKWLQANGASFSLGKQFSIETNCSEIFSCLGSLQNIAFGSRAKGFWGKSTPHRLDSSMAERDHIDPLYSLVAGQPAHSTCW